MARPMKHKEALAKPVSFRMTEADFAIYKAKVDASGLSPSEFFRDAILTNKTRITAVAKATPQQKELMFLFKKTSNNMNQIAHQVNTANRAGKVDDATYVSILQDLEYISKMLKAVL